MFNDVIILDACDGVFKINMYGPGDLPPGVEVYSNDDLYMVRLFVKPHLVRFFFNEW